MIYDTQELAQKLLFAVIERNTSWQQNIESIFLSALTDLNER